MNPLKKAIKVIPPVLWVIIILMVFFSISSPRYLSMRNAIILLQQGSVLLVIGAAATIVIISGGLDLSLGGVLTIAGVITVLSLNTGLPIPLAILLGVLAGTASGVVTGLLVAVAGMRPFIATLGMQGVLFGLALVLTDSVGVLVENKSFLVIGDRIGKWIPMAAISCAIVFALAVFVQNHTRFGRYLYAIGGNEEGARLSGVNTKFWKFMVYTFAAFLSSLGGIILAARLEVADPIVGMKWEFEAIAAAILGGTSLRIGRGDVRGTIIGVALITVVRSGLNVIRMPSVWQPAVIGTIIILSIVFQVWVSSREFNK